MFRLIGCVANRKQAPGYRNIHKLLFILFTSKMVLTNKVIPGLRFRPATRCSIFRQPAYSPVFFSPHRFIGLHDSGHILMVNPAIKIKTASLPDGILVISIWLFSTEWFAECHDAAHVAYPALTTTAPSHNQQNQPCHGPACRTNSSPKMLSTTYPMARSAISPSLTASPTADRIRRVLRRVRCSHQR